VIKDKAINREFLEILIPTYNRSRYLEKNLVKLIKLIEDEKLTEKVSINISNNCSTDDTRATVENIICESKINIKLYNQKENIGLEKNSIFLLNTAQSDYIMYIGDDDFLPEGYLTYVFKNINESTNLSCILPGLNGLLSDGNLVQSRIESFNEKVYTPTFKTLYKLSHIGHQMSGVLLKRENLLEEYTKNEKLRNLYPFIFFVSYNLINGKTIYVPKFKTLVSIDNVKDWKYDKSGLVSDVFKNYKILFKKNYLKRNFLNLVFIYKQSWRIRIGESFSKTLNANWHLLRSKDIELLTKIMLPALSISLFVINKSRK